MTSENGRLNASDEARHGDEALDAVRFLADGGFHRDVVSRSYYAAFHWARAVLLTKGIEPRTHRGVIQMFSLHFVKDGPLAETTAADLASLETYRELSDYTSAGRFGKAEAAQAIARAEAFIAACRALVPGGGG